MAAHCHWRLVVAAMLFCVLSGAAHAEDYYTINIGSSVKQPGAIAIQDQALAQKYIVYSVKIDVNGISRYRQRIGFFASRDEARNALDKLSAQFPGAWIDRSAPDEKETLNNWLKTAGATAAIAATVSSSPAIPAPQPVPETNTTASPALAMQTINANNNHLAELMQQAKTSLVEKNYANAIQIYNKVISTGDSAHKQDAQEYLGVARERNGQLAHATAEYKKYLELYPAGENSDRVRQRLNGLLTAADKPQARMKITEKEKQPAYWDFFGTAFQFYDRDTVKPNTGDKLVANSLLTSGINYSGRLVNGDYKMRTNFSAVHIYDFVEDETDKTRVNDMYFDMISPAQVIDTRIGRQKGRSSGVVGRFDGFDLGYRLNPSHQVRLIAGYPVEFSGKTVAHETDKQFYSVGYTWTGFLPDWEASVFSLQQVADGITDREEVGGELRFRTEEQSFFAMLDYSTAFSEINYIMMVYNRHLPEQATLDIIADYRKSPFLTTSSSLQGQTGVSTMGDLSATLSEEELAQLALDRTGLYKSVTAIYTRPIKENLEFNTDFSISNLSGTDATAAAGAVTAVEAQTGTGNEYSYSAGLVSSNLLTTNDVNIVNARYSDLFNSKVLSLSGSSKYRIQGDWRLGPKLQIEQRDYDDGRSSDRVAPSIRVEYNHSKNWQFESEITLENKSTTSTTGTEKESSFFIHLGYYYIF